ncbi:MAG TPA: flagellar basal-body rod protein FlgF [Bacteroidota bacterium]|nr:flagellar basal-body rod protein FlgF [Bacteroidota bacterium]
MIKGIYSSSAGMQPRMTRMEVVANNLANIDTTGYKRDNVFFKMVKENLAAGEKNGSQNAENDVQEQTDFSSGALKQTNNTFDLAVTGNAFFTVETPNGLRYTRNGNFNLAMDGTIVTNQGYPVLGTEGKIQLPDIQKLSQGDVTIDEEGVVNVDNKVVGKLRLAVFDDTASLQKDGSSMFIADTPERSITTEDHVTVQQGFLEESNVDAVEEMVSMIQLSRDFEADQKAIQSQDSSLEKAMDVGRVSS